MASPDMMASMDMNLSKLQEIVEDRGACMLQSMGSQRVRHDLVTEQVQCWQETHMEPLGGCKLIADVSA